MRSSAVRTRWNSGCGFGERSGLFYTRADGDPKAVEALPERYTAVDIAEKVVRDIDHWDDAEASVCRIAEFDGLQHTVHGRGAAISRVVE